MSPDWIAATGLAGLATGPLQRAAVFTSAVPAGVPLRRCCPGCGERVTPGRHTLPPITVWVTGRCHGCELRIGLRPLVLELLTAAVFTGLAIGASSPGQLAAMCLFAAGGTALGFIDAAVHRLPNLLTLPLYAGVTVPLIAAGATGNQWEALLRAVLAGAALAGFYMALVIVMPAGIGAGDAKLALAAGTALGWYSWPALFTGTFCAFLAAALYAAGLIVLRRASPKDSFAFGPFMIAGALVAILAASLMPAG